MRMTPLSRFKQLSDDAKTRVREISPAEAARQHSYGAVPIDVRESVDFAGGHAPGAVHLNKGVVELQINEAVPDVTTSIVCYCGGGSRSALAADRLQKMGYTNVVPMAGGLKVWKSTGLLPSTAAKTS
jgi:phage shock protein E